MMQEHREQQQQLTDLAQHHQEQQGQQEQLAELMVEQHRGELGQLGDEVITVKRRREEREAAVDRSDEHPFSQWVQIRRSCPAACARNSFDVRDEDLLTHLHHAASMGFEDAVVDQLGRGANVEATTKYGSTPLS